MTQWLRPLVALSGNLRSIPSTHIHSSSQPSVTVILGGSEGHLWPPEALHTRDYQNTWK